MQCFKVLIVWALLIVTPSYASETEATRLLKLRNAEFDWFDGNPSSLFPLSPKEEAQRIAELAGGEDVVLSRAKAALAKKDFQWAAQLCDHLLALYPTAKEPKLIKADALDAIAQNVLSGIGRNYYQTVSQELRKDGAKK